MIPQLASRSLAIEGLFAPPFHYVSPSFQRPFAWDLEDAERLLADLLAACLSAPDHLYFLGTILLLRPPLPGETPQSLALESAFSGPERIFEIVDGQQRIVTLAVLLAVLRDLLGHEAPVPPVQLQKLTRAILLSSQSSESRVKLRGPDQSFLTQCVAGSGACLVPPQQDPESLPQRNLLEIRDYFVRQLKPHDAADLQQFATFLLTQCAVVSVVTSTIDRAYQMFTVLNDSGKPLTRNDILKAELMAQVATADRAAVTATWDDLEHRLGPKFEDLFSYVRAQAGRNNGQIVEAVRAQVAATPGGATGFITGTLAPAGGHLDVILRAGHQGVPQSGEINHLLRYLNWLPGKEWVAPLLSFWAKHGSNATALLAFLQTLDRFAYGVRIQGLGAEKRGQRMAALVGLINTGAAPESAWEPLLLRRDELRAISFNLRDLHRRGPQICRLVLLRLNEHCGGAPAHGAIPQTVEHILPLKVGADSQWRTDFPDIEVRQKLAACLGNLTLVPQPVNERAANQDFARKTAIYFAANAEPVSRLTDDLRGLAAWTPPVLEARHAKMAAGINDLWQFEVA